LSTTSDAIVLAVVVASAGTAAAIDLRTRRIPNLVPLVTAALGFTFGAGGLGGRSMALSAVGFLAGLLVMLPGHLKGATGAGDVKLFAALGSVLGPVGILTAFVYTAVAGGVLALAVAAKRKCLALTLREALRVVRRAPRPAADTRAARIFPYGPAILAGTVAAALFT
jgi:Flp pilus assembly protein protease CpaA